MLDGPAVFARTDGPASAEARIRALAGSPPSGRQKGGHVTPGACVGVGARISASKFGTHHADGQLRVDGRAISDVDVEVALVEGDG